MMHIILHFIVAMHITVMLHNDAYYSYCYYAYAYSYNCCYADYCS